MLFNSAIFMLGFLPLALAGFYLTARLVGRHAAVVFLGAASIGFYAWGDSRHLPVLVTSIVFNLTAAWAINHSSNSHRKLLFVAAVTINVLALAYYKYAWFIVSNIAQLTDIQVQPFAIELPVGISFFTFTQIAYLYDCYRREADDYKARDYLVFVTFFPHLIAGPILYHRDFIPQLWRERTFRPDFSRMAIGWTIFTIGLFKKVVLADGAVGHVDLLYNAAAAGAPITFATAWTGALAFTFQLYFDFSGYSDMAFGLACMFGLRIPINFLSPYKSTSIIDFWRRWHISLSRFLSDHIYKPLGGNRRGQARRFINLMITMLIGGLWHGAGWTFVLWGGLHGLYLVINHGWRALVRGRAPWLFASLPWRLFALTLTFLSVVLAWVLFKASSLTAAGHVYAAMIGMGQGRALLDLLTLSSLHMAALLLLVMLAPNTYDLMRRYLPGEEAPSAAPMAWRMKPAWGMAIGAMGIVCVFAMFSSTPSPFLYFQF